MAPTRRRRGNQARWPARVAGALGLVVVLLGLGGVPAGAGPTPPPTQKVPVPVPVVTGVVPRPATSSLTGLGTKVLFPTRPVSPGPGDAQTNSTLSAAPTDPNPLQFGGGSDGIGVFTTPAKVYVVFWGSQWGTSSTGADGWLHLSGDPDGVAPRIQALMAGLGTNSEAWSGTITQYCEGVTTGATSCPPGAPHVVRPSGGVLAGVRVDGATAAPAEASDLQIAAEATSTASAFGNTTAATNRNAQYIVVSPPGAHPAGFNVGGGFCAFHDAVSSPLGDIAFQNLPYIPDAGVSCGMNYVNSGSAGLIDGVTIVGGHEYVETITDPIGGGGWSDIGGWEVADKCAWTGVGGTGGAQNVALATGSFPLQGLWANDTLSCRIAHATVTDAPALTTVGSATTERLMETVLGGANEFDVHARPNPALTVPADAHCGAVAYGPTAAAGVTVAPTDAAAGRDALRASVDGSYPDPTTDAAKGCVDIARSGSDPRPVGPSGDHSTFEYYAMALDAVSWATPSLNAPAALTLDQLRRIFNCQITSWSQLPGGGSGPIQRVMPPAGTDTAVAFVSRVLGFDPTAVTGPGCPAVLTVTPDRGDVLTDAGQGGSAAQYQRMILPYSAGTWVFQSTNAANPTLDTRNGVRVGAIVTRPADPTSATYPVRWSGSVFFLNNQNNVVSEANPNVANPADASVYPGVHYLYDVIDRAAPDYAAARDAVGFDAGPAGTAKSALCSGANRTDILSAGFIDLAAETAANGNPGVTCRLRTP